MVLGNIVSEVSNYLTDRHENLHKAIITRIHPNFVVFQF